MHCRAGTQGHPMKPHRMRMTHDLLLHYDMHKELEVRRRVVDALTHGPIPPRVGPPFPPLRRIQLLSRAFARTSGTQHARWGGSRRYMKRFPFLFVNPQSQPCDSSRRLLPHSALLLLFLQIAADLCHSLPEILLATPANNRCVICTADNEARACHARVHDDVPLR